MAAGGAASKLVLGWRHSSGCAWAEEICFISGQGLSQGSPCPITGWHRTIKAQLPWRQLGTTLKCCRSFRAPQGAGWCSHWLCVPAACSLCPSLASLSSLLTRGHFTRTTLCQSLSSEEASCANRRVCLFLRHAYLRVKWHSTGNIPKWFRKNVYRV